jgi:hypothetical protein
MNFFALHPFESGRLDPGSAAECGALSLAAHRAMAIPRPEQRPHYFVFNAAAEATPVKDPHTNLRCLRHEQQHDAADHAGDTSDQLGTDIFLHQKCAAQQQGHQGVTGDEW